MLFQPSHSPNTISSHLNLIFSFSKNLKQCFLWKITHKRKSYFYPLGLKQVLSFHFYRDYLKISLCWEWKYNVFVSSRKKYRGPEIDRCLDQRKKTCYIISRTIYLQICILLNWNKYYAINYYPSEWSRDRNNIAIPILIISVYLYIIIIITFNILYIIKVSGPEIDIIVPSPP